MIPPLQHTNWGNNEETIFQYGYYDNLHQPHKILQKWKNSIESKITHWEPSNPRKKIIKLRLETKKNFEFYFMLNFEEMPRIELEKKNNI